MRSSASITCSAMTMSPWRRDSAARSIAVATWLAMDSRSEPSCLSSWLKMARMRLLLFGGGRGPMVRAGR